MDRQAQRMLVAKEPRRTGVTALALTLIYIEPKRFDPAIRLCKSAPACVLRTARLVPLELDSKGVAAQSASLGLGLKAIERLGKIPQRNQNETTTIPIPHRLENG